MSTLEILTEAIEKRKPISFEYNKEGKIKGQRFGHPYAIFIFTAKNTRIQSTKVHVVQTGGVSDSGAYGDFRMFNIEELSNVQCLSAEECFEPTHENYNPEWDGYINVIAKV